MLLEHLYNPVPSCLIHWVTTSELGKRDKSESKSTNWESVPMYLAKYLWRATFSALHSILSFFFLNIAWVKILRVWEIGDEFFHITMTSQYSHVYMNIQGEMKRSNFQIKRRGNSKDSLVGQHWYHIIKPIKNNLFSNGNINLTIQRNI